jgi:predicted kinase
MTAELFIYRGLPGSGKTFHACAEVQAHPRGTLARINRDDFRRHVFLTHYQPDSNDFEDLVTALQHGAIRIALNHGTSVLVDDINLIPEHTARLMRLAIDCDAKWWIRDFTHIPLSQCIDQDRMRPLSERVGAKIIRALHDEHSFNGWAPLPIPSPYSEVPE